MTYSYGRALQQSALKFWSKDTKLKLTKHRMCLIIEQECTLAA